jgi:DNA gyrase/topoisomerase IV subunit A
MRSSYIDYSMSVIVGRALPDARDGLKPVHRRVLFAMRELGNTTTAPTRNRPRRRRRDRQVPPHGDQAVYDTIVRMAQDFSMRYPLVDGQGNFGSIDGDPPAAMRYTEVRMDRWPRNAGRYRQGHRRFRPELRRVAEQPLVLPAKLPQPAAQRLHRHRRRHGHQHPAAQPGRAGRRRRA